MMQLTKNIKAKTLARLDELIERGNHIVGTIEVIPALSKGRGIPHLSDRYSFDQQQFAEWRTNCLSILQPFQPGPAGHQVDLFRKLRGRKPEIEHCVGILRGVRGDLEAGFLDELMLRVETEIAGDYLGQAEQLLAEGKKGRNEHVPAAVLAGAVLEKALRSLCPRQTPPVSTSHENGKIKTLGALIDDLKTAGLYNETKAKHLRAWAAIRNDAAHGDFEKFTKQDVEGMLKGVAEFFADYLDKQ